MLFQLPVSAKQQTEASLCRVLELKMGDVFKKCQIALELGTSVPFKEKQKIRKLITENDGTVSFVLNKKVKNWPLVFLSISNMKICEN